MRAVTLALTAQGTLMRHRLAALLAGYDVPMHDHVIVSTLCAVSLRQPGIPAAIRAWLERFRRRSAVAAKAKRMAEASIAPFARFGGNDRSRNVGSHASVKSSNRPSRDIHCREAT